MTAVNCAPSPRVHAASRKGTLLFNSFAIRLALVVATLAGAAACSGGSHSGAPDGSARHSKKPDAGSAGPRDRTGLAPDSGGTQAPDAMDSGVSRDAGDGALSDSGFDAANSQSDAGRAPHPVSKFCGDAIRDPVLEECDDGPGTGDDSCSADCRARAVPLLDPGETTSTEADGGMEPDTARQLGTGPHVASGLELGFATVFVEGMTKPAVRLQLFGESGARQAPSIDITPDRAATLAANPVIAALSDTRYAVAWTDGSGGTPDVLLRSVDATDGSLGPVHSPHDSSSGFQQDPDLLWTGTELVVAWTDLLDVKYRRFDADFQALDAERYLGGSNAIESSVTLAPFGSGWAAALRANREGLEQIEVTAGDSKWSTAPAQPGPIGDRPALAALDDTHLLLVYSVGTDPLGTGNASVGRLMAAMLSTDAPGTVAAQPFAPLGQPLANDTSLAQRRPSAVRVESDVYVAWENAIDGTASHPTEVLVARVELAADGTVLIQHEERSVPFDLPHAGSQQNPRLGSSRLFPGGALITLWEETSGASATDPALMLDFRPSPFVTLPPATKP